MWCWKREVIGRNLSLGPYGNYSPNLFVLNKGKFQIGFVETLYLPFKFYEEGFNCRILEPMCFKLIYCG